MNRKRELSSGNVPEQEQTTCVTCDAPISGEEAEEYSGMCAECWGEYYNH